MSSSHHNCYYNEEKVFKLAVVTSHPVQYQAPLFRKIAAHRRIDLKVYYCSHHGVELSFDQGFGQAFKYDVPLMDGYQYEFLRNWTLWRFPNHGIKGLFNPGVIIKILKGSYAAIFIHDFIQPTSVLACLSSFAKSVPVLFHGEASLLNPKPSHKWFRVLKNLYFTMLFRIPGRFLAIGTYNKDFYRYFGVSKDKIFLTPYSVDNEFFQKSAAQCKGLKYQNRRKLGITKSVPVILYVGKLIERKKPLDLLKAFEYVKIKFDAALLFLGDGAQRVDLEKYVWDKNIADVHFIGFKNQTELSKYYELSDVFVLPSQREPWGLVVNEAMVHGMPVIVSDAVGAAPDLVRSRENGFVYPACDVNALIDCLSQVLSDKELRQSMGRKSLEIISNWNYDGCVDGILAALDSLRPG